MSFPIEIIVWDDAKSEDAWVELTDIKDNFEDQRVKSIGWVVLETKKNIHLASNVPGLAEDDAPGKNYSMVMTIPKGMIISRKKLLEE